MTTINISNSLYTDLNKLLLQTCIDTVKFCSEKYNFSQQDALNLLQLSTTNNKNNKNNNNNNNNNKSTIPLPFDGTFIKNCCSGLKNNHGLYTQCLKNPIKDSLFCNTCFNQSSKNSSGKPNNGTIHDRIYAFNNNTPFIDPNGKSPSHFATVLIKLKISTSSVIDYAAKHNITIDPSHLSIPSIKRGRPKKNTSETTSLSKKPRGRPKNTIKSIDTGSTTDLFASLISQLKNNDNNNNDKRDNNNNDKHDNDEDDDNDDDNDETISVKRFQFNGHKFLISNNNTLYDPITQNIIGYFDTITQTIHHN
jgi:hypothetical protein